MGIGTVLFLIFLVLKLTNVISWSWWWVFSPIWIPLILVLIGCAMIGLAHLIEEHNNNKKYGKSK
jgi:uncharacterized integral membrane protein